MIKLGFVSAVVADQSFEATVDLAAEIGYMPQLHRHSIRKPDNWCGMKSLAYDQPTRQMLVNRFGDQVRRPIVNG